MTLKNFVKNLETNDYSKKKLTIQLYVLYEKYNILKNRFDYLKGRIWFCG